MSELIEMPENKTLGFHLNEIKEKNRVFENVFQTTLRMILMGGFEKVLCAGKTYYDYPTLRAGKKHLIGLYDIVNSFVSFIKEASEGGSAREMAFVLVGEPGNGKTFFVDFVCQKYREFLRKVPNKKYTIQFTGMDRLGTYGDFTVIPSQTFEDPMILAMNMREDPEQNKEWLLAQGFSLSEVEKFYENYRPLGACSQFIWNEITEYCDEDLEKMLNFIKIIPVPINETQGVITGKYPAKDKITSSASDLLGEEDMTRLLHLKNPVNPFRYNVQLGALARVAGGGIHFADEMFKNKSDLVLVYLSVTQNRTIDLNGFKWFLDTLIIATSNNEEYNQFVSQRREGPIHDRCRVCYMPHNTDYKLQEHLTDYAIGSRKKTTITGADLHEDPNLNYAASVAVMLSRMPKHAKLTQVEMMKLAAGEIAGDKSVKTLAEVVDELDQSQDVTKRWGQKGIGQRNLGRSIQLLVEMSETNEGQCMFAKDIFSALRKVVNDYVLDPIDREKFLADLKEAKKLFRERIQTDLFNAYMDDPDAVRKDVMNYVNMIIGCNAKNLGPDKRWGYRDPQTGLMVSLKIDEKFMNAVEAGLGLTDNSRREAHRNEIRDIYAQKAATDPNYNFMDNLRLVKAVTDVKLKSDISGASSLAGALANRNNEDNQILYSRILDTMTRKLHHCTTCAEKTIEYFCSKEDES